MEKIKVDVCLGTTCFVMGGSHLQELTEILPKKYGGDAVFANKTLMVSMILSLITLPVVISLLK